MASMMKINQMMTIKFGTPYEPRHYSFAEEAKHTAINPLLGILPLSVYLSQPTDEVGPTPIVEETGGDLVDLVLSPQGRQSLAYLEYKYKHFGVLKELQEKPN